MFEGWNGGQGDSGEGGDVCVFDFDGWIEENAVVHHPNLAGNRIT